MFRLFKKSGFDPQAFEKELTDLTDNISATQQQISRLKARYTSIRRILIQYLVLAYVGACLYNYSQIPATYVARNKIQLFVRGQTKRQMMFVGIYPVVGYLLVKVVRAVFNIVTKNRTNRLKVLKDKHRAKIDELKKITNFNTTANLLNKYGEKDEPVKKPAKPLPKGPGSKKKNQPVRPITPQSSVLNPVKSNVNNQRTSPPNQLPAPVAPKNRPIQDRLLDLLIGSDNNESIENRYALICVNCFTHNGLAPPNSTDPSKTKFACLKCGFLNGTTWQDEIGKEIGPLKDEKSEESKEGEAKEAEEAKEAKEEIKQEIKEQASAIEPVEPQSPDKRTESNI